VPTCSKLQRNANLTKAQLEQYSLEILYPKEPLLESTLTIDIVAVDHYDGKSDSAWSFAYPTPATGPARKPSPAREPQVKSQSRTKAPQDGTNAKNQQRGKGEPIRPIMEKGRAPTAKVLAERELPPQEGPTIFFSEKEPSSKIVSLTDEHQPTKASSLLGKERVSGTPLPKFTTEGGLRPNDQSAKAGFTTGLKTESLECKAREKPRPVSWLNHEDMLPKAFPDARVLRFRYPIMSGQSDPIKRTKSLDLAASRLSSRLIERRKDCPNRLILFIGHDFGVVVIERALIRLADTVREKNPEQSILESTIGIIFLATPLKGLESSDYFATRGDWFRPKSNASTASMHNTTSHQKNFKAAIEKRNIFLYRVNSINKFSAPSDGNYLRVLGLIRRFVNSRRLLTAAANEADEVVSDLIDQGVDSNVRNGSGQTALHIAIQKGRIRMARLLLGRGGADINLQDTDGQTAIHLAAEKGNPVAVDFLLGKGADVNVKNNEGFLAIDLAKQGQGANMQKVLWLLGNPRLLDGPSGLTSRNWTKPIPPTDPKGLKACEHFRATLTEFFFIKGEERRNTQHPSIWEVLYGEGPEPILYDGRPPGVGQATCRWFHVPANNVSEISCPGRREV
jgi:Ankyrin repeats (3 copies)